MASQRGLEDAVLQLLSGVHAAQQQQAAQQAENAARQAKAESDLSNSTPFVFPAGLLGGGLSANAGLDLALALQSGYSLPMLMSSAMGGAGQAGPLNPTQALTLPSVPSSELPKLLSLDLSQQQELVKREQQQQERGQQHHALMLGRQGSDRGAGPSRQQQADPGGGHHHGQGGGGGRRGKPGGKHHQEPQSSASDGSNITADEEDEEMQAAEEAAAAAAAAGPSRRGGKGRKGAATGKEQQVKAQQRALKKRDLNREAQRRFRDRQKAALAILEETNRGQQQEIQGLRVTNKLMEEQYRLLLDQYKQLQLRLVAMQMEEGNGKA